MHVSLRPTRPWLFLVLLAIATAALIFGIHSYRFRFVQSDADMLRWLPSRPGTVFFANVAALRDAGMLNLITGTKSGADPEYQNFVRQTHFDYSKDLNSIAGEAEGEQVFFMLRGNFDWRKLREYAGSHGGSCTKGVCKVPATRAGRWISFRAIQPNVMLLALSGYASAIEMLPRDERRLAFSVPREPVWVNVSMSLLKNPVTLPQEVRIFAISLQSADSVLLSLGEAAENSEAAFRIELDAACPSEATADTTRNQLEIETKMLKLELAREHRQPNPADLTGFLTAGTFQVVKQHVIGSWPVRKQLLNALE